MARPRELGEAHVIGDAGVAIAVRVSVLLAESAEGPGWAGHLRGYRPLALRSGRYRLRVRGEDVGMLRVRAVRTAVDRETADFLGEGEPSGALRRALAAGDVVASRGGARFPRVAGAEEPTAAGRLLGALGSAARALAWLPARLRSRRRGGMAARPRR